MSGGSATGGQPRNLILAQAPLAAARTQEITLAAGPYCLPAGGEWIPPRSPYLSDLRF
jgi:hypothetical protein